MIRGSRVRQSGGGGVQELCNKQMITGFPSIRIYRKGSDEVVVSGRHMHEAYKGDRTEEALKAFVDKLVPSAGSARTRMTETRQLTLGEGCMVRHTPRIPTGRCPNFTPGAPMEQTWAFLFDL